MRKFIYPLFILFLVSEVSLAQISGSTSGCDNQNYTYTGSHLYSNHNFTISGGTFLSNSGNQAVVNWNSSGGTLYMSVQNPFNGSTQNFSLNFSVTSVATGSVGSKTVCENSSGTMTLSGHAGSIVKWQKRENQSGGWTSWSNISNTSTSQSYSSVDYQTQYKALVATSCGNQWSSTGTLNVVNSPFPGGLSSSSSSHCNSGSGTVTVSNYTGSIVKWQKRDLTGSTWSSWANINTTSSQVSYNISKTTEYRVQVDNAQCSPEWSLAKRITIYKPVGGNTSGNQSICTGDNATVTLSGHSGTVSTWQYKTETGSWTALSSTSGQTALNISGLSSNRYYRAKVTSSSCIAYSSSSKVTVNSPTTAGLLTANGNASCISIFGQSSAVSLSLSGQADGLAEWQKSTNGGSSWTVISPNPGGGSANTSVTVTQPTLFRVRSIAFAGCDDAYTNTTSVWTESHSAGTLANKQVCRGDNGNIELTGNGGSVIKWQSRTEFTTGWSSWSDIANATTVQSYSNILLNTEYKAFISTPCEDKWSNTATITVVNPPNVGVLSVNTNQMCSTDQLTLTFDRESGVTGDPQYFVSQNGGSTWDLLPNPGPLVNGSISFDYVVDNVTVGISTLRFKVSVAVGGVCGDVDSNNVQVSVDGYNPGELPGSISIINNTGVFNSTLVGHIGVFQQWEYSTNPTSGFTTFSNTDILDYSNPLSPTFKTVETIYVKAKVASNNGYCSPAYSNTMEVHFQPDLLSGEWITEDFLIDNSNGVNQHSLELANFDGASSIVEWQSSIDQGLTWTAIVNSTPVYLAINLQESTWFRVKLTHPDYGDFYSPIKGVDYLPFVDNELDSNFTKEVLVMKEGVTDAQGLVTLTNNEKNETYSFYDGLGRGIQQVSKGISPSGNDVVAFSNYDNSGMIEKDYLPYTASGSSYYTDNINQQILFYTNASNIAHDTAPYSETVYDNSPLNRIIEKGSVGADWQPGTGHTQRFFYSYNTANEVRRWNSSGVSSTYYPAKALRLMELTDENDNKVREFIDSRGNTILKQVEVSTGAYLNTYNIYDIVGRVLYTIPPKAMEILGTIGTLNANNTSVAELIYHYSYDNKGRLVERKIPGKSMEYIVYDNLDRAILTQDGNQRANNQWMFAKYDRQGRAVYSGVYTNTSETTRTAVQALLDGLDYTNNDFYYEMEEVNTTFHGYSNRVFPTTNIELLSVNYYDHYDFDRDGTADINYDNTDIYGQDFQKSNDTYGLATGSKVKILGTTNWKLATSFYNEEGRVIQTLSDNHLSTEDIATVLYNDKGEAVKTKSTVHGLVNQQEVVYDHAGRLSSVHHTSGEIVKWNATSNLTETANGLQKTTGGNSWNGGAVSTQFILSDMNGKLEFIAEVYTGRKMIGLSTDNINNSWNDIEYAFFFLDMDDFQIREKGGSRYSGKYNAGDVFTIRRVNDQIYYYKNNTLIPYSGSPPTNASLTPDISLLHVNTYLQELWLYQADQLKLAEYTYNELGQLIAKKIHGTDTIGNFNYLQESDYRYNIKGWLESINDPDNIQSNQLFGMKLYYNEDIGGTLNQDNSFNGNISAMKWKNNLVATAPEKAYTYEYDKSDRLSKANYGEGVAFIGKSQHYALDQIGYDANGNITNLRRKTSLGVASANLDDLTLNYSGNGMTKTEDAGLADGFDNKSNVATEYIYDANGNMISDANKDIASISYNVLNKPETITFDDGAYITYLYDGTGNKLAQELYVGGVLEKRTDYIGNAVYENDTLQFFSQPEGRVVVNEDGSFEYQYAYTDHLGNVRMMYTSKTDQFSFKATFETQGAEQEDDVLFQNVTNTAADLQATSYDEVQRLVAGAVSGAGISIPVYPGDTVDMSVQGFYRSGNGSSTIDVPTLVAGVASIFGGLNGGSTTEQNIFDAFDNTINPAVGGSGINDEGSDAAAYLNYIIFDKNMVAKQTGYTPIPSGANGVAQLISLTDVISPVEGFVYVYLTNESNAEVYFDDFEVTIKESMVVQNTDYYPFGLQHSTSWTRITDLKNNFLYNAGSELNEKTKNYETFYRQYDPAIGRFTAIDPYAAAFTNQTPYNYAFNDPVALNDPMGDFPRASVIKDVQQNDLPPWDPDYLCATCDGGGGMVGNLGSGMGYGGGNSGSAWQMYQFNILAHQARYQAESGDTNALNSFAANHGTSVYENGQLYNPWIGEEVGHNQFTGGWMDATGIEAYIFMRNMSGGLMSRINSNNGSWITQGSNHDFSYSDAGHTAAIGGIMANMVASTELGVGKYVMQRGDKLLNGTSKLHSSYMNLADDAPILANRFLSGSNTLKLTNGARIVGRFATGASIFVSGAKIASGNGTTMDYVDIGVNAFATYALPALITAGTISNPVGWYIGGAAIVYNGYRIYQDW